MILTLMILSIYAIFFSFLFKKKNYETILFSILLITFIMYIFGILNLYIVGLVVILLGAISSITFVLFLHFKKNKSILNYVDLSLVYFLIIILVLYYIIKGSQLVCLDEFTAWGLFAKITTFSKKLYIFSGLPALAKNYQSATAIFQSFIEILNFKFSEDILFMAINMIYVSATMISFKKCKKNIHYIINSIIIFLLPLSMLMWPMNYYSILVDIILGFVLGYILYYNYTNELDTFGLINISLSVFFLCCSKLNGILLALVAITMIYIDLLLFKKRQLKKYLKFSYNKKTKKIRFDLKKVLLIFLPFFTIIFTYISWNAVIFFINIKKNTSTSVMEVLLAFKSENFKYWLGTFIGVVKSIILNYKVFGLLLVSLIISILSITKLKKGIIKRSFVAILLYIMAHIAYIFFLFLVCSTMVNVDIAVEALRRYLYTLVAADMFIIIFSFVNLLQIENKRVFSIILILLICFCTDASYQTLQFIKKTNTYNSIEFRNKLDTAVGRIEKINSEENIVYILTQTESVAYAINYELLPGSATLLYDTIEEVTRNKESHHVFSLTIMTNEELRYLNKKRKGNIYVYVFDYNEEQKEKYSIINGFDLEKDKLYQIIYTDNDYKMIKVN